MNIKYSIAVAGLALLISAFCPVDTNVFQFHHSGKPSVELQVRTDEPFAPFQLGNSAGDDKYTSNTPDKLMCTVILHKLGEGERTESPGVSPKNAMAYFVFSKRLKASATNEEVWYSADSQYIYRVFDIKEQGGMKLNERHYMCYTMLDEEVLATVHIYRTQANPNDITRMLALVLAFEKKQ